MFMIKWMTISLPCVANTARRASIYRRSRPSHHAPLTVDYDRKRLMPRRRRHQPINGSNARPPGSSSAKIYGE
jgi:hypothetical protein